MREEVWKKKKTRKRNTFKIVKLGLEKINFLKWKKRKCEKKSSKIVKEKRVLLEFKKEEPIYTGVSCDFLKLKFLVNIKWLRLTRDANFVY